MVVLGPDHIGDFDFEVFGPVSVVKVVGLENVFAEYQPGDKPDFSRIDFLFLVFHSGLLYHIYHGKNKHRNMMDNRLKKAFWYSALVTFIIKCMLAAAIPLTSDEAYFVVWAKHLDFGYYDHPPMIAWVLRLFMFLGNSELVLRLPAILSTILIGIGIYLLLKKHDHEKALLAGILFLLSPLNLLYVLVSTDTPIIFFAFLSAFFLSKAIEKEKLYDYFLSGVFLGAAFLSKYFAALLGFTYLVYYLISPKDRRKTAGFLLLFAAVIPFVLVNLCWNYTHAWANIMFNVFNRNKQETFSLGKALLYLVSQAYLITPPIIYYIFKKKKVLWKSITGADTGKFFAFLFILPLLIFFPLSFKKTIGLHWVLAFYPFLFVAVFYLLSLEDYLKSIKFMLVFSFIHLFVIGAVLSIPLEYVKNNKNYAMIIMGMRPKEVAAGLKPYEKDFVFATGSYAESAVMGYHYGRYFIVFGGGSQHGRQDDIITDFRGLNGWNILILRKSAPDIAYYKPLFGKVELQEFEVSKAKLYIVLGYGFKYENYRNTVLSEIKGSFYNIPRWLPLKTDYFSEKYSF
jgi:hypothetical protein